MLFNFTNSFYFYIVVMESLHLHIRLTFVAPVIFVLDVLGIVTKIIIYISGIHTLNLS